MSVALAAALLSGCDDEAGTAGTTVVKIDPSRCFGGSDGIVPGNCRSRLDELALASDINGCFVALRDGESTIRRVAVQWSGGQLRAKGEEVVSVAPGGKIRASLFLYGAGGEGQKCTAREGPGPDDACDPGAGCVVKLSQSSTAVPEQGVTFDFFEAGRCQAQAGLLTEAEACDGLDNDCDGVADELYAEKDAPCEAGEGACRREGVQVCNEAGDALVCSAAAAGGGEEICDDADNDCDGRIDEGLSLELCCDPGSAPIGCGQPVADSVCVAGTRRCEAVAGQPKGQLGACVDPQGQEVLLPGNRPEICDGVDDDCDGNIDEDIRLADADDTQPGDQPAAVGEACRSVEGGCVAPGTVACGPDRQPFCDHPAINRGPEVCDTVDNDCDGQVDETFQDQGLGDACMVGTGACAAAGIRACAGPDAVACNVQPGDPAGSDLCGNGIDDDCDGRLDEGHDNLGMPCSEGQGACRANGAFVCTQDGAGTECSARPQAPVDELCNGADDDCDGQVDEDFDLATDARHCGACGTACAYAHATGICAERVCGLGPCDAGWHDADGDPANGCEYACQAAGDEVCNGRDDDCDGRTDEGFDLQRDPSHCGRCDRACVTPNATPACVDGDCAIEACADGRWDNNQQVADGCEYACLVTRGGVEACDEIDNDCNGTVDDGFDLNRDPANCGLCGFECDFPNAVPGCVQGACVVAACEPGFVDLNDEAEDGCELACTPTPDPREICDTVDNDCDGVTDEGFDLAGDEANCGACGRVCAPAAAVGQCRGGVCRVAGCDPGFLDLDGQAENGCEYACVPAPDGVELCNGADDDCDGQADEDYDLSSDVRHCGRCGLACGFPNGVPGCVESRCTLAGCERGFHDLDGQPANGCEYGPCVPTNGGVEICDAIDNDCDGTADEGFDLRVDLAHCGGCGRACDPANAAGVCVAG
ncbi:MAG: hypothetical protein KC549_08620, partial [Myxococcales bacterium]|nr:hypothetical protein [Myxococcales bacterium]